MPDPGPVPASMLLPRPSVSRRRPRWSRRLSPDLNQYLPQDIAVLSAENVPERFRADLNAIFRTYEYRICTEEIYNVFRMKYEAHCFPAPDISLMEEAAGFLKGRHDFRCFSSGRKKKGK